MPMTTFDLDAALARQGSVSDAFDLDAALAGQPTLGVDPPTTRPDKSPRRSGEYHYAVPLPDPGVVAATAPIALGPAMGGAVGAMRAALPNAGRLIPAAVGIGTAGYRMATGSGPVEAVLDGALTALGAKGGAAALGGLPGTAGKAARAATKVKEVIGESKAVTAAKVADRGRKVAAQHAATVKFAKEVAAKNPKVGEKIWMLLDDAGNPVTYLTPDQAGAAARRGAKTFWVRNLWGK